MEEILKGKIIVVLGMILIVLGQPIFKTPSSGKIHTPPNWFIETVDYKSSAYTSIALDSGDKPHISYQNFAPQDLKYAKWTGSGWNIETVDSVGDVGLYNSIALDSGDNPHISYVDWTNEDLKYARWTGSDWSIQTVDSAGWVSWYPSLALDSGDNPHISYQDSTNGDLKYAKWTGSTWSIETVDSDEDVGWCTSLTLDSGDNPHISYQGYGNLLHAWWTGSTWYSETVASAWGDTYTSIAIDSLDNPHITYLDRTNGKLKYAWWTGSTWSIEAIDSSKWGRGLPSIALDSDDNPCISYTDMNRKLKYATRASPNYQYHVRISPYENVIHMNVDAGGWINGYMTGLPIGWNPVLGKVEGDRVCMAIDVYPDERPGYRMLFLIGKISTMKGQVIMTHDGMSYDGPLNVELISVSGSEEAEGPDITEASGGEVAPDAWYRFRLNPFTDIINIHDNPSGWLNGYDEPAHPVLGFFEEDRFYFAIDGLGTEYTLVFNAGSIFKSQGELIRTRDGKAFDGPHSIWLTWVSSEGTPEEGESALLP